MRLSLLGNQFLATCGFALSAASRVQAERYNSEMEARYLTNESGERIGVVLDVAEYECLRRSAEEAARAERHPGIAFRGTEGSRRAWVSGTALDVWEIVVGHEEMGRQRLLEETGSSGSPTASSIAKES